MWVIYKAFRRYINFLDLRKHRMNGEKNGWKSGREKGKNKEIKQGGKERREKYSVGKGEYSLLNASINLKKFLNQNTLYVIIFMVEHIFIGKHSYL